MMHPIILKELAEAYQRDRLAEAEARRLAHQARNGRLAPHERLSISVSGFLTSVIQRLQEPGQRIREGQAVNAFKQDTLSVACEDPACAC
jgi:hypothetical protein